MKIKLLPTAVVSSVLVVLGGALWQIVYIEFIREPFGPFPAQWSLLGGLSSFIFWILVWVFTPNRWWDV